MRLIVYLVVFLFLSFSPKIFFGQHTNEGSWDLGINTALYIPSNYHAEFYSGAKDNVNNVDFIFGNKYRYNEIKNIINASDTFYVLELPQKMKYTPSFMIGIYFKRWINNNFSMSLAFNYSKLTSADFFSVHVDPNVIFTEEDIRLYEIWGKETRSNIDLSLTKYYNIGNDSKVFTEFGFNFNFTEVAEHQIGIETQEFSLVNRYLNNNYVPNTQLNEYDVQQGGVGYGVLVGGGFSISNHSGINVEPGLAVYIQKINLESFDAIRPAFVFYVRFSLGNYFADET